jgi:hypothetical protein
VITVPPAVPAFTLTTSVIEADVDAASVAVVQVRVPVPPTGRGGHVQPAGPVTETNVVFVGMTSLNETELSVCGPSLRTLIEYVMLPPTLTGSGESAFVTRRFAPAPLTAVVVVAVLLAVTASSGELTVALFVITVPAGVAAVTYSTRAMELDPTPTDGLVQAWVPVPPSGSGEHVHPAAAATETNVVPAGVVSETVTFDAASGPAFVTVIEYVMFEPARTGSGASILEIERSAIAADAGAADNRMSAIAVTQSGIERMNALMAVASSRVSDVSFRAPS